MNYDITVAEPSYVFIYILNDKLLVKDLIKLHIAKELKRIYGCPIIAASNVPINGIDYVISDEALDEVNYPNLCDIMRRIPLGAISSLNIKTVFELSKLFGIASLAVPGHHVLSKDRTCILVTDDDVIDFTVNLINEDVMKCNILKQIPSFVKDLDIDLTQKQLRKTFGRHAFSGGKDTKEEQKQFGADLSVDESFSVLKMFADKSVIERVRHLYGPDELKTGEERMLSGEVKALAADALFNFIQTQTRGMHES